MYKKLARQGREVNRDLPLQTPKGAVTRLSHDRRPVTRIINRD